ncbi:hypothetical protein MAMMFC1_02395 [Methylomusa anaerophila]|uniref:6-hydroxymethylpterin diphosphokinase MptE-like domain-containing protein n=1 Tax=Methylomusa anaerophila TaxID=1930071 RepID=A0A348AKW3_9FIRM|nr:hypothetical protein MAMMFC1_02395 [Methylomusa anaerophila]
MGHIREIRPVKAHSGSLTLQAETGAGRNYFLHSVYDPEAEAQNWLKWVRLTPNTAYLVYGFGFGYYVKALLDKLPENCRIFVIEYSYEESFARAAAQLWPDMRWMADKRIVYLTGPNIRNIVGAAVEYIRTNVLDTITVCRHFAVMQLFPEFFRQLEDELVREVMDQLALNVGFALKYGLLYLENCWRNLPHIFSSPGNGQYTDMFNGMPAIIVASGPSLDKNVDLLHHYLDKAVIIAASTAIGALNKRGIVPHFLVAIDPNPAMYQVLCHDIGTASTLVATYDTDKDLIARYPGPKLFCRASGGDDLAQLAKYLPAVTVLQRSLSGATVAFEFANHIGADPIIFIGQDMAFAEGRSHATGVRTNYNENDPQSSYYWVKGQNGEVLKANRFLKDLREYFISRIATVYKNKTIINATEGGAYLDGAMHMPLREAATQYFGRTIDVAGNIARVHKQFTPANPKRLLQAIQSLGETAGKVIKEITSLNNEEFRAGLTVAEAIECYQKAFAKLRKSNIYPFIAFYIDACYLRQVYEHREGCPAAQQLADWEELFRRVEQALTLISSQVDATVLSLQNKRKI